MKKKTIFRILFWVIVIPVFFVGTIVSIRAYIENNVFIPVDGILVVDGGSSAKRENGSEIYPFRTISAALAAAQEKKNPQQLLIKEGDYMEVLELKGNVSLIGIGRVTIKNEDIYKSTISIISGRPSLQNLHISGGKDVIAVKAVAGVAISHCEMTEAKHYNLINEAQDSISEERMISVRHSKISLSKSQGMYLRKAKIQIEDCVIEKNDEEGIDLHTGIHAVIKNNEIIDNGEGGIETEVGENNLLLEGNSILRNGSSGINMQSSIDKAQIFITKNEIKSNRIFGIRCSYHSEVTRPYFAKYISITSDNVILENGSGEMPGTCTNKNK